LIAARAGAVRAVVCDGAFHDIGTPADYVRASRALNSSAATIVGARARIAPSARVVRSILWDDVAVGAEAIVEDCILGDAVEIPPGEIYRRAAIVRRPHSTELVIEPIDDAVGVP
jgi:NDP-sugar pyrophosphorylase family protein